MSDFSIYDNTGATYNVSRIITPQLTLDEASFKEYSPLFLSTSFAISYGLSFATIASLIVYTFIIGNKLSPSFATPSQKCLMFI